MLDLHLVPAGCLAPRTLLADSHTPAERLQGRAGGSLVQILGDVGQPDKEPASLGHRVALE